MTIILKQVAKTFANGTIALKPTNLEIAQGEILSLLGPSGCGKTTLLRILAGLESGNTGAEIFFDDDNVTQTPVEKRRVGMVFQSYALFPNMTVSGNVGYGLKMQGLSRAQIRSETDKALGLCKLTELRDRSVHTLSGGQRQRVALARAVAPRPRLLLLDEPLSALDAALRDELRDELAVLLRRFGTTAVFVTHDQSEALAIADRVAVMNEGNIVQVGKPELLYRRPASAFVAGFVGGAVALDGYTQRIDRNTVVQIATDSITVGESAGEQRITNQSSAKHGNASLLTLAGGSIILSNVEPGSRIFVRAESLSIDNEGPLSGTVESVAYHGTHFRVAISGISSSMLIANHSRSLKVGEQVSLKLDEEKILVL